MSAENALLPQEQGLIQDQAQIPISGPASLQQFSVNPQELIFPENPLFDLGSSPFATIHIDYPCKICSSLCGITYKYDTYLGTGKSTQYLFRSISKINCSICCASDPIGRFGKCISFGKSSYQDWNADDGSAYVELDKNKNCACYGCYDVLMDVNIISESNRRAGTLKIKTALNECCDCKDCCKCGICCKCITCDCYKYAYCCEILSPEGIQKYAIFEKRCCLSCVSGKSCGLNFEIYNPKHEVVGNIEGNGQCCGGFTYRITFPSYASVEDKLCLLNAIYAIDTFGIY